MPELGPYGSVRGARGNSRLYRDPGSFTTEAFTTEAFSTRANQCPLLLQSQHYCSAQRSDAKGQEETHAPQRDPREKREAALPGGLSENRSNVWFRLQAAVRLAFSTARRPAIASSTATLACSIDAIA